MVITIVIRIVVMMLLAMAEAVMQVPVVMA